MKFKNHKRKTVVVFSIFQKFNNKCVLLSLTEANNQQTNARYRRVDVSLS